MTRTLLRDGAGLVADGTLVVRFPIMPHGVLDTLAFPPQGLRSAIEQHLASPHVAEAIYLASPGLHEKMQDWQEGKGDFGDIETTLTRYLSRMSFRATPFGTFTCVSSCTADEKTRLIAPDRQNMRRNVSIDSVAMSRVSAKILGTPELRSQLKFFPNDTRFTFGDGLRLIYQRTKKTGKKSFSVREVERDKYLDTFLEVCDQGATCDHAVAVVSTRIPGHTAEELADFFWQLVDQQVLTADYLFDITSQAPLRDVGDMLGASTDMGALLLAIDSAIEQAAQVSATEAPERYRMLSRSISKLGVPIDAKSTVKVDLFAPNGLGSISQNTLSTITAAVTRATRVIRITRLERFCELFTERYGDEEVSLARLATELDSLGYGDPGQQSSLATFIGYDPRPGKVSRRQPYERLLEGVLARALPRSASQGRYLDLGPEGSGDESALSELEHDITLVAWFSLWTQESEPGSDPLIELRSVGSQEPGRVMGRFAFGLPRVHDYLSQEARSSSRPVVELIHLPHDRGANISGRPQLSDLELRIRASGVGSASVISLKDLTLRVARGRVYLRSVSLDKDVELRMSNAQAFENGSYLAVYRLLNHISNQDYGAELISLRKELPSAPYVPGLKIDNVIVARPTWLLDLPSSLSRANEEKLMAWLHLQRRDMGIPAWVTFSEGDNVIPYNLDSARMAAGLLKVLRKKGRLLLTEVYPEGYVPFLESPAGRHFHEIQVALRRRVLARNHPALKGTEDPVTQIWGEWIYFKLHCVPSKQDELIAALDVPIGNLVSTGVATGAFFIRYSDQLGSHLRFRIKAAHGHGIEHVLPSMRETFGALKRSGLISRVSIEPYVREVARYGGERSCSLCEEIFCLDSRLIADVLKGINKRDITFWQVCATAIDTYLQSLGLREIQDRLEFAVRSASNFALEMDFTSQHRKKIGEMFKTTGGAFSADGTPARWRELLIASAPSFESKWAEVLQCLSQPADNQRLYRLRWSLVHMRMNRLLDSPSRTQEAIIWELLKRSYMKSIERKK